MPHVFAAYTSRTTKRKNEGFAACRLLFTMLYLNFNDKQNKKYCFSKSREHKAYALRSPKINREHTRMPAYRFYYNTAFMYNNTFEALFLTSTCLQSDFLCTQTVAPHLGLCMAAHDSSSQIAPNRELFTNYLMHYVLQYVYNKK